MNLKAFLRPTPDKVILLILLLFATSVQPNILFVGADIGLNYGYPFHFYGYGGGPALMRGQPIPEYFHVEGVIMDVVFWYIVSCVIVGVYHKVGKK